MIFILLKMDSGCPSVLYRDEEITTIVTKMRIVSRVFQQVKNWVMKKLFSSDFDSSISKLTLSIGNELSIVNFSSNLIKLSQEQENKLFKAFRGTLQHTRKMYERSIEIAVNVLTAISMERRCRRLAGSRQTAGWRHRPAHQFAQRCAIFFSYILSLCFRRNFEICHKFQSCLSKNCEKCFKSYLGIIFNVCRCK